MRRPQKQVGCHPTCGVKQQGIQIQQGCKASLKSSKVLKSASLGVLVAGPETELEMDDCVMSEPQHLCVQVTRGGIVSLHESLCSKSKTSHGVSCREAGSVLKVVDCRFERNESSGIFATQRSNVVVQSCHCKDNAGGGFWVQAGASVKLNKCSSKGGEHGCGVTSRANLQAEQCTITGSETAGYHIEGKASVHLCQCDVTSFLHCGIVAGGAGTKL